VPGPDGLRIAYLAADLASIWVMGSAGNDARPVVTGSALDSFLLVTWSGKGSRLGYHRRTFRPQGDLGCVMLDRHFTRSYETVDAVTGALLSRQDDIWMESAAEADDGRLRFLRFTAPGSAVSKEIWEAGTDSRTGGFAHKPERIAQSSGALEGQALLGLTSTRDGAQLLVLNRSADMAVFIGEIGTSKAISNVRRFTLNNGSNFPDAWTPTNDAVIYESDVNGRWDLFLQGVGSRLPKPLNANPSLHKVMAQLAPDGKSLLFTAFSTQPEPDGAERRKKLLWMPLKGGEARTVPLQEPLDEFRCSMGITRRCILRKTEGRKWFHYFDLDPVTGQGEELARTAWQDPIVGEWSVSPDGNTVAIPNHDPRSGILRLISLNGKGETELNLPNISQISGVVWSVDSPGWYVTVLTNLGGRMIYVTPDGKTRALGDFWGLALPSPNGRLIAFRDHKAPANAWILRPSKN
jgi:hypothetical protein